MMSQGADNMIIGILISIWIIIAAIWTLDFIFSRIEAQYLNDKRKIEQVSRFAKRNNISPEETKLLFELVLH